MLAANERLIAQFKSVPGDRYNKAWDLWLLGDVCELAGNLNDAEKFLRQAIYEFRKLAGEFPRDEHYQQTLAGRDNLLVSFFQRTGKPKAALAASAAAVEDARKLANAVTANPDARHRLANTLIQHGDLLGADGQWAEAGKAYRAAVHADPANPLTLHKLAIFLLSC